MVIVVAIVGLLILIPLSRALLPPRGRHSCAEPSTACTGETCAAANDLLLNEVPDVSDPDAN
jgi:hypothetical protein